jgi:hypothetical protein
VTTPSARAAAPGPVQVAHAARTCMPAWPRGRPATLITSPEGAHVLMAVALTRSRYPG